MRIACPKCRKTYTVSDSSAGKKATCKNCDTRFKVPSTAPAPSQRKPNVTRSDSNPKDDVVASAAATSSTSNVAEPAAEAVVQVPARSGGPFRWLMFAGIVFVAVALVFGGGVFLGNGFLSVRPTVLESDPGRVAEELPVKTEGVTTGERPGETVAAVIPSTPPVDKPVPFEFRGLPLGSTFVDVKAAYKLRRGLAFQSDEPEVNKAEAHFYATGIEYAGEKNCTVNFKFWKRRLYEVHVFFPREAPVDLIAAFTAKYGEPSSSGGLSSLSSEAIEGEVEIAKAIQGALRLIGDAEQGVSDSAQWANERYRISIYVDLFGGSGKRVVFLDMQAAADVGNARAKAAADQL